MYGFFGEHGSYFNNDVEASVLKADNGYEVVVAAAGMVKEGLEVTVDHSQLKVNYQRPDNQHKVAVGSFYKSWIVGDKVDTEGIVSELKNGLLTIKVPLKPEAAPRKITVN